jgi:methyl-accepting chemotaxis protein
VNHPCRDFRIVLEGRLDGRAAPERLGDLAWNDHLFTCAECRALLDAEEALESLLAGVPEPELAPAVRARVLARLRLAREEDRLDRLLDAAVDERAPVGLAAGVLAALAAERAALAAERAALAAERSARAAGRGALAADRSALAADRGALAAERGALVTERGAGFVAHADRDLDRLLDLDTGDVPAGLAQRTLAALRRERVAIPSTWRQRRGVRALLLTAAAAALVTWVWIARPDRAAQPAEGVEFVVEPTAPNAPPTPVGPPPRVPAQGAPPAEEPRVARSSVPVSDEVLAVLDLLENWDVLVANDGDALLTTLPTADEALLDVLEGEG